MKGEKADEDTIAKLLSVKVREMMFISPRNIIVTTGRIRVAKTVKKLIP